MLYFGIQLDVGFDLVTNCRVAKVHPGRSECAQATNLRKLAFPGAELFYQHEQGRGMGFLVVEDFGQLVDKDQYLASETLVQHRRIVCCFQLRLSSAYDDCFFWFRPSFEKFQVHDHNIFIWSQRVKLLEINQKWSFASRR